MRRFAVRHCLPQNPHTRFICPIFTLYSHCKGLCNHLFSEDAEKAVSKVTEGGSKTKYFTDNLSKLDRNKRKLVQQIMVIVRRIVSKDVADQIQEAIEKEFR